MNSYVKYQQSIAAEFAAQQDRVRFFIDDAHWGEDGRYKEVLLADYLRTLLPSNASVGTGFVKNADGQLSSQIDIIIYRNDFPLLFRKGDFVILPPDSVLGMIEVKSSISFPKLSSSESGKKSIIEKCYSNGTIVGRKDVFNGIWSYGMTDVRKVLFAAEKTREQLKTADWRINHIAFNSNYFCRYWSDGNPIDRIEGDSRPCHSFYNLSYDNIFYLRKNDSDANNSDKEGLAYGYFISNLLECVYRQLAPQVLNNQYYEFLYPLEHTKEAYRINGADIKQDIIC